MPCANRQTRAARAAISARWMDPVMLTQFADRLGVDIIDLSEITEEADSDDDSGNDSDTDDDDTDDGDVIERDWGMNTILRMIILLANAKLFYA